MKLFVQESPAILKGQTAGEKAEKNRGYVVVPGPDHALLRSERRYGINGSRLKLGDEAKEVGVPRSAGIHDLAREGTSV